MNGGVLNGMRKAVFARVVRGRGAVNREWTAVRWVLKSGVNVGQGNQGIKDGKTGNARGGGDGM